MMQHSTFPLHQLRISDKYVCANVSVPVQRHCRVHASAGHLAGAMAESFSRVEHRQGLSETLAYPRVRVSACPRACRRALRLCVRACLRACLHTCSCAFVSTCEHASVRASVRACERACVPVCLRACVHARGSVCLRVYSCARGSGCPPSCPPRCPSVRMPVRPSVPTLAMACLQ